MEVVLGNFDVLLNVLLICHHRTHWNSTEYQMKHAFRSATTYRLHPEIPHPCSLASCVYSSVLAQVHNLLLVGWKSCHKHSFFCLF